MRGIVAIAFCVFVVVAQDNNCKHEVDCGTGLTLTLQNCFDSFHYKFYAKVLILFSDSYDISLEICFSYNLPNIIFKNRKLTLVIRFSSQP